MKHRKAVDETQSPARQVLHDIWDYLAQYKKIVMSDRGIFKAPVKLFPERRAEYLDQACGPNHDVRREVEALLRAHDACAKFLQDPPARSGPFCWVISTTPGDMPYEAEKWRTELEAKKEADKKP